MKLSVMLAVVCLLLLSCLVEGQNMTGGGTLPPGVTPAGSAATCYACSATNDTTDACFAAPSGSVSCPNGVCIVTLVDDENGDPVSIDRGCHSSACTTQNDNTVYTQSAGSGGTSYEKCCDNAVDCNNFSAEDLRSAAGKLTAGLAAILFGAIFLLVL